LLPTPTRHHLFPTRRSSDLIREHHGDVKRFADVSRSTEARQHLPLSIGLLHVNALTGVGRLRIPPAVRGIHQQPDVGGCVSAVGDRKSTRLNSSHGSISYAV